MDPGNGPSGDVQADGSRHVVLAQLTLDAAHAASGQARMGVQGRPPGPRQTTVSADGSSPEWKDMLVYSW